MQSYQTARSLYSFLGFLAWCVIILGGVVAFGGGAATQAMARNSGPIQFLLGAAPGILVTVAGVYGLALVQSGRTSVDTAEYAQQALVVSRQQLEISKQVLELSRTKAATYAGTVPAQAVGAAIAEPVTATDESVSYANQPTSTQPVPEPTQAALPEPVAATPAIAAPTAADIPMQSLSTEIIYKDGLFAVGEQAFKTKGAAVEYQKELIAAPVKDSIGS